MRIVPTNAAANLQFGLVGIGFEFWTERDVKRATRDAVEQQKRERDEQEVKDPA